MMSNKRFIDVACALLNGVESVQVQVDDAVVVLDINKARFLMSMLKDTIDAQEANRRVREMKVRFDLAGAAD